MTGTSNNAYQGVAPWLVNEAQHRRDMARTINALLIGKLNVAVDVTVTPSTTSTTITDARIGFTTAFIVTPMSSNGALVWAAGWYYDQPLSGSVTIHHTSWALANINWRIVMIG